MQASLLDLLEFINLTGETEPNLEEFQAWLASQEDQVATEESEPTTLIDAVITTHLSNCLKTKRLPTVDEAKVIFILDGINSKYN